MTYKEFFEQHLWDADAILQAWEETPARLLPTSLGRGRKRKNESQSEWKERSLELLRSNPPTRPESFNKNFGHMARNPETLRNLVDVFGLTDEEVERYGFLKPRTEVAKNFATNTERRQRQELRLEEDGLEKLRACMACWVYFTLGTKKSEAICDLDCTRCGSPRLVHCAAQNLSPIHHDAILHDDFTLSAHAIFLPDSAYVSEEEGEAVDANGRLFTADSVIAHIRECIHG